MCVPLLLGLDLDEGRHAEGDPLGYRFWQTVFAFQRSPKKGSNLLEKDFPSCGWRLLISFRTSGGVAG